MDIVSRKTTDEKPMLVEKAQSVQEIKAKEGSNPYEYITKEELERLFEGGPETHVEIEKFPIQMSATDLFNSLAIHQGAHSFEKYFIEKGEPKVESQPWIVPDPAEEYDGKPVL
jgi:hypothetical protein